MEEMKKRLLIVIGVIVIILAGGFTVFRFQHKSTGMKISHTTDIVQKKQTNSKKRLIIYFSLSGSTEEAAKQIKADTGADIIRLQPQKAYPSGYDAYVKVAQKQLADKIHPAIRTKITNLDQYDTIFVGYPTWWHQPPMIIHSLFEKFDFSRKTIVPFTTSMSDPVSRSMPDMRKLAKGDNAKIINGFRYDDNKKALAKFLNENDLN